MTRLISALVTVIILFSCSTSQTRVEPIREKILSEITYSMKAELLDVWYPRVLDMENGGYLSSFTYDWKPTGEQDKMIVSQSRHVWTSSKASQLYPENKIYKTCATHGFNFLKEIMWDKTYGGFYWLVDQQGKVKGDEKTAYGNSFAVYALAAYYGATQDTTALNLAKKAFMWLEKNSHDPVHKGYFQHLTRTGKVIPRDQSVVSTAETGYKDQNSSIHLLEAFAELYQVWPDPLLKERLEEMLVLIRDTIVQPKGYMYLFFTPEWKPISFRDSTSEKIKVHYNLDHVSFGHDVEIAYLMLEAAHVLGKENDKSTMQVAKRLVDHSLDNGWDNETGGFYDAGYYFKDSTRLSIIKDTKNWWAQAEGLNTLLLMADYYPSDPHDYFGKFTRIWEYINTNIIDHEHGEWYQGGIDKEPEQKTALKAHIWKASYHQFRALSNCAERLRKKEH